jgi:hypothetical protein
LTLASRVDLASAARAAAERLNDLTVVSVNDGSLLQDARDNRLVWTLYYLADVVEGKKRN